MAALFLSTACYGGPLGQVDISTDRACYFPGTIVKLSVTGSVPDGAVIRYRHGADIIAEQPFSDAVDGNSWSWQPPEDDYQGYLVDLYTKKDRKETILATCAVDVSSSWTRYPRYGFVADFDDKSDPASKKAAIQQQMAWLNRCHINGVQFQDWQWMHHRPVKLESNGQLTQWYQDISSRRVSVDYIKQYIAAQHGYGMQSIFYDLCFGAWKNAAADGVKPEWGLFVKNSDGTYSQDRHELPSSWQSDIFLENPSNTEWQSYFAERTDEVYDNFGFDGFQIDQLGNRGWRSSDGLVYDYHHNVVDLPAGYASFIDAMKVRHSDKTLIMNAVSGYGASDIVGTGKVGFCYNEVWGGSNGYGGTAEDQFANLYEIIKANDNYSGYSLPTVFAAYVNYNKADNGGSGDKMMNTPGVLLTDAVMFALGGSHLELGDHMLSREYFPAAPLAMSTALKEAVVHYYDFLTAYEQLLRGTSSNCSFTPAVSGSRSMTVWPPKANTVTVFAKNVGKSTVVHFLNFLNTDDLSWRDVDGTRMEPQMVENTTITIRTGKKVSRLWVASPDTLGGAPVDVPFTQNGDEVTFVLPSLKYWTMAVMEGEEAVRDLLVVGSATATGWDTGRATQQ